MIFVSAAQVSIVVVVVVVVFSAAVVVIVESLFCFSP